MSDGPATSPTASEAAAQLVRDSLPAGGLFADQQWRVSPEPFRLDADIAKELESLGRVLHQFYKAVNLLYRKSVDGKMPAWVAQLLDQGKPSWLVELQRHAAFKNDTPRVIRPDILLTDGGFHITELDSVPGGIGLTAWLNETYSKVGQAALRLDADSQRESAHPPAEPPKLIGSDRSMLDGFAGIFGSAERVNIIVSEESAGYRPEMEWLAGKLGPRFTVHDSRFTDFRDGDSAYRFFELFDTANVPNARPLFDLAAERRVRLTPPPKPIFEEKMLFALLWNRNLRNFWREELGEGFFNRLLKHVPYTWVLDPAPLPPNAAYPQLDLTDWHQLKTLSQKDRELILKVSGYSEEAWGARGVYLGSDLSQADWSVAVDKALAAFPQSPHVLQRFHKPRVVDSAWFDFATRQLTPMPARVRLCPYYFVHGEGDQARPHLAGVLATICPADKKIIHGMKDAILAPCAA